MKPTIGLCLNSLTEQNSNWISAIVTDTYGYPEIVITCNNNNIQLKAIGAEVYFYNSATGNKVNIGEFNITTSPNPIMPNYIFENKWADPMQNIGTTSKNENLLADNNKKNKSMIQFGASANSAVNSVSSVGSQYSSSSYWNQYIPRSQSLTTFKNPPSFASSVTAWEQLEYGVTPTSLNSMLMPPVRLRSISSPLDAVTFTFTPTITENVAVNYSSYDIVHLPVELKTYKNTSALAISMTGKFISRNTYEASINLERMKILRAWTKPYFGEGTAAGDYRNYLGAPPPVLKFDAYGQNHYDGLPVALGNLQFDWPETTNLVYTALGAPINVIQTYSITLIEMWSPEQISNFSIDELYNGNYVKAFAGTSSIDQIAKNKAANTSTGASTKTANNDPNAKGSSASKYLPSGADPSNPTAQQYASQSQYWSNYYKNQASTK